MAYEERYSYFCDESCHLPQDQMSSMGLGAVWLPTESVRQVSDDIRAIKARHGIRRDFEAKWTAVSPAQYGFYADLVEYFFDTALLRFRAVVVRYKDQVRFGDGADSHDDWYYKMYYQLLGRIVVPPRHARVYLDIKDSQGGPKVRKLHEILGHALYDFDHEFLERIQIVRSHEVEPLQLTDLLTGAVTAAERGGTRSQAKLDLIKLIEQRAGRTLGTPTSPDAVKFNVFYWMPKAKR